MRNLKLTIRYDGTDFHGWQTQPGVRTIQPTLEAAIVAVTHDEHVYALASGRTDAGVHAVGQVVNFHTEARIPADRFVRAVNAHLPPDVVATECAEMPEAFNANRDAVRKMYRYVIHDGPTADPFMRRFSGRSKFRLDAAAMRTASEVLVGTHDFHSFETEWPNRASSVRTVTHLAVSRAGEFVWIDIEADGFLYNMVRAIAGTLMNVGRGFWPASEVAAILAAENRDRAGPTAPPEGLFLMRVTYE